MSHSFLTVFTMSKALAGKQSLSCSDIAALSTATEHHKDHSNSKQRRSSLARPAEGFFHRFTRSKSPLIHSTTSYSPDPVGDIDQRLIQIREQLSMFREQDMDFRERLDSLSNSIDELASRSSLASSEVSDLMDPSDVDQDDLEDDDRAIENDFKNLSMSFSTEVLNCIPSITVTPYRRCQSSDPLIHEWTRLSDSTASSSKPPQRTYSSDQLYW